MLERTAGANPRVAYVTMLGIRALLVSSAADYLANPNPSPSPSPNPNPNPSPNPNQVSSAADYLAKGCTVAIRYSAVRRQGFRDNGDKS
jgi:hypothetical protein